MINCLSATDACLNNIIGAHALKNTLRPSSKFWFEADKWIKINSLESGRFSHGFNAYPNLCQVNTRKNPREFMGKIYFDSLVHDEDALQLLIKVAGEDKVENLRFFCG